MAEPWLDRASQLPILAIWKAASRKPGTLGAPASCRLCRHGGSRRQGGILKLRYFVVRTRCGRDARGPRGGAWQRVRDRGRIGWNGVRGAVNIALSEVDWEILARWGGIVGHRNLSRHQKFLATALPRINVNSPWKAMEAHWDGQWVEER